jgi:aryl-alcohol dehydrogenase-like predicted oxidoreductase
MNFGAQLDEAQFSSLIQRAYEKGIRTFMTADVYGSGAADEALGRALSSFPRSSYCLVGMIGHDFYSGLRDGQKGFPRFTDPRLRQASGYSEYVQMAAEKSLERCKTDRFDCLLLHNPDSIGYSSDAVWKAMHRLQEQGITEYLGVAPGPANGFTLDLILCFERFKELLDWAMIILNPLEPWPGSMALPAAVECGVDVVTRVVDYGGIFHDDVKPGHTFGPKDHRTFRPEGWVDQGNQKLEAMRDLAEKHGLTMLQLACLWNLAQAPVKSVVPTLIQEVGPDAKPIEAKLDELAALPERVLTSDEVEALAEIGNNKGCMALKGGNPEHTGDPLPDRWSLNSDLQAVANRWRINPAADLTYAHAPAPAVA